MATASVLRPAPPPLTGRAWPQGWRGRGWSGRAWQGARAARLPVTIISWHCQVVVLTLWRLVAVLSRTFLPLVTLYRLVPLRTVSRTWGWMNSVHLPPAFRVPVLTWYIRTFGVKLEECVEQDLKQYNNLGEFFSRRLLPQARPVHPTSTLVSPSDGRLLSFGVIEGDRIEQVKGLSYPLQQFVGPPTWLGHHDLDHSDLGSEGLKLNPDTDLFYCILYLAPGDYHGFHSPAQWTVYYRRHFPGSLLSVSPGIAQWIQGLFNFNERVMCAGQWRYGFFSLTAVGATNVGSITIEFDKHLRTNRPYLLKTQQYHDLDYLDPSFLSGVTMEPGDYFGMFHLGSSIVLIFEAPKTFQFSKEVGETIRMGEALGSVREEGEGECEGEGEGEGECEDEDEGEGEGESEDEGETENEVMKKKA